MNPLHTFLMPDYFPDFACKMGECRHACCVGWPIRFSLKDYFHLTSRECSPEMRDHLDHGIQICLQPTPEEYAQFTPRLDGNCYMRLPDGRCALHAEFGEDALTDVCRLYPRGIHDHEGLEISCSNSCEAAVELMFSRDEPIRFSRQTSDIRLPPMGKRLYDFPTLGHMQEIRLALIRQMQDRAMTLPQRLLALKSRMLRIEQALDSGDESQLLALLAEPPEEIAPLPEAKPEDLQFGIETAEQLLELFDEQSVSVRSYGEEALRFYGIGEGAYDNYVAARNSFEQRFPRWEICFEHLLVNHMFFSGFPYQDRPERFNEEFTALCVVYTFLRFLSIGWISNHTQASDFIDVYAAAFRLIDHTNFERSAIALLRRLRLDDPARLFQWIRL